MSCGVFFKKEIHILHLNLKNVLNESALSPLPSPYFTSIPEPTVAQLIVLSCPLLPIWNLHLPCTSSYVQLAGVSAKTAVNKERAPMTKYIFPHRLPHLTSSIIKCHMQLRLH